MSAAAIDALRLPPIADLEGLAIHQKEWREKFAECLYGPLPNRPLGVSVTSTPLPDRFAERLDLRLVGHRGSFCVSAALWRPDDKTKPAPLICGLDFLGPIGVLGSEVFPLDENARVFSKPELGVSDGKMHNTLRGTSSYRWPVELILDRGYALMISCYGSWTPDDVELWNKHGVLPEFGPSEAGAISCWAWSFSRLIDAAEQVDGINVSKIAVVGHSRLGKAALWASANDPRIRAVFANNSGCAGAALSSHPVGESLGQLKRDFPHWLRVEADANRLGLDQHQLIALSAPRAVYIASAANDIWSDPEGTHAALSIASEAWRHSKSSWPPYESVLGKEFVAPPLGTHIRLGDHDLLEYDWRRYLDAVQKIMLPEH